ncbi:MAG: exopolysaccharide biosynthesis protein [Pseudomonadota bacterium]
MQTNTPTMSNDAAANEGALGFLTRVLDDHATQSDDPANAVMTLGDLSDRLQERAFGMVLLVLALPCCLPFVYLLPQIVALPMLLLTSQMALGRHVLWLPEAARAKTFPISAMRDVIQRARRWIGFLERFAHARMTGLVSGAGSRIIGALLMVPCASILLPLPLTNTVPGIGVTIAAIGLIERDGLLTLFGLIVGLIWVAILILGGQAALTWLFALLQGLAG